MITVAYNEPNQAVQLYLDVVGANLLIKRLEELKKMGGHFHIYMTNDDRGLSRKSPYLESVVYGQMIVDLLPADAWECDD